MKKFVAVGTVGWIMAGAAILYGWRSQAVAHSSEDAPRVNVLVKMAQQRWLPETGSKTGCKLMIGDALPKFAASDFDGKPLDVESLCGEKATLLICWATWCGPCMAGLQHEVRLARAYEDKGLRVIGINADKDVAKAKAAIDVLNIPWPMIYEPRNAESPAGATKTLGIHSWPTLLLFDGQRKLIAASPYLNMSSIMEDSEGNHYQIDSLDWTITRVLGPLDWVPIVTPVLP